eukprot:EG_transcript_1689
MTHPPTFFAISGLNDSKDGDDDLYGGFGGSAFPQQEVQMRPPSQGIWGGPTTAGIWQSPGSSMAGPPRTVDNRPMSSHRKAGYTASTGHFDPLKQGASVQGPAPPLQKKSADSPEEQCLEMERKVNALIEESAQLSLQKDYPLALEKAKEASKKERMLCKHREQQGLGDQINIDLTYSVHFNLAVQYQKNQLYTEALNTYSLIVRNKQYAQSGRLRVNMGNIYYEQNKLSLAIKMYRLALDQIPNTGKDLKYKIVRNIGNAYVRIGQYQDAIGSYETIMEGGNPDIQTGFNLLLCYYALGDRDKLKRHFTKLLSIRKYGATDDDDLDEVMDEAEKENQMFHIDDPLRVEIRDRRKQHMEVLLTAARLIAPMIEKDWMEGFNYIIEQLRHYELKDASSRLASEMQMCKALQFLKYKKYSKAIEALKAFEKKDKVLKAKAATNLSYLYFLEGDIENGQKYADMSIAADKYNAKALVNRGNFYYVKGEYDKAKELYMDALAVEADCIEAMYNLGLTTKQLGQYEESQYGSLHVFKKLQSMIPDSTEVCYHIANLYDLMCDYHNAGEWFNRLVSRVPTDPTILARLGAIYAKEDDEAQAFHYHLEAYRYFPVNMDVISWLGAYFVKNEVYEKAMQFFERAAQIQPNEVKWQLMVASCHRRIGAYPQAKALYEEIHKKYPDNAECLRYLVHICNDSGMKDEAVEYHKKLKRLEARMAQEEYGYMQRRPEPEDDEDAGDDASGYAPPDLFLPRAEERAAPAADAAPAAAAPAKVSTSAARISKRQQEAQQEAQKAARRPDDEDFDMDVDEMLPGM